MANDGRAYLVTNMIEITTPGSVVLISVPANKKACVVSGVVSVNVVSGAGDYVDITGELGGTPHIFHCPTEAIGVFKFGPYQDGIKVESGEDVIANATGLNGGFAQLEYYLEDVYGQ